jgi:hypothetical protein
VPKTEGLGCPSHAACTARTAGAGLWNPFVTSLLAILVTALVITGCSRTPVEWPSGVGPDRSRYRQKFWRGDHSLGKLCYGSAG